MAREQASDERAAALFTDALLHNKETQTRHGRSNATNEQYISPFRLALDQPDEHGAADNNALPGG
jgi:hypothetical protein